MEHEQTQDIRDEHLPKYISTLPRDLHRHIISGLSATTQRLVNKESLKNAKIVISSITFEDIANVSNNYYKWGKSFSFIVYDYKTINDEDLFRVAEFVQYYDPNEYISKKGIFSNTDGYNIELNSSSVTIVEDVDNDYDIKQIGSFYKSTDHHFDLYTINEILSQKGIPVGIRKELLKLEYKNRLEQLEDEIPHYLYAVNFLLFDRDEYGNGEWDIPENNGMFDDINEIIPDYQQKLDKAKFLINNWIDTLN